ncbi:MAG: 4Fe-4S dicluster domain-containing protein [Candidatus Bathyarchaeia archaeon]
MSSLKPDFMHEVANTPRGRGVLICIQCGRCSSSCPVARLTTEHNPRRLMEMIILGSRSEVLPSQLPWYCLSCFTCLDRCPQGGDVGEAMFAIRNLAVREGNVPEGVVVQARSLLDTGRVVNPTRLALVQREKLSMGKGQSTGVEDVRKILKRTAFDKLIGRI